MPRPVRICIARCRRSARSARRPASRSIRARRSSAIEYVIDLIDLVLVMSVNPGFGGQAFIKSALGKISDIRAMTAGRPIDIEVDGGVGPDVSGQLAAAGANALVAGSAVFKGGTHGSLQGQHCRDPQRRGTGARRSDLTRLAVLANRCGSYGASRRAMSSMCEPWSRMLRLLCAAKHHALAIFAGAHHDVDPGWTGWRHGHGLHHLLLWLRWYWRPPPRSRSVAGDAALGAVAGAVCWGRSGQSPGLSSAIPPGLRIAVLGIWIDRFITAPEASLEGQCARREGGSHRPRRRRAQRAMRV